MKENPSRARSASNGPAACWDTGVMVYQALCVAALLVIALVEMQEVALLGMLIFLIGLWGLVSRRSVAPVALLVSLAGFWAMTRFYFRQMEIPWHGPRGSDALLCGAVLTYVAAHYRLQALTQFVVPRDPRRRLEQRNWLGHRQVAPQPRSPRLASRIEVGLFVLALPVWVLIAHVAWLVLERPWNPLAWPTAVSQLLLLTWFLGLSAVLAASLLGIWKQRQQTPDTAAVILQDILWRETRGDQRRITRWLSWARLKRRGENP